MGKSRKEIAYDYIKPKIVFCELKPGDILDEKKIIEELGFSRTPIREAISELAEEKLVQSCQGEESLLHRFPLRM